MDESSRKRQSITGTGAMIKYTRRRNMKSIRIKCEENGDITISGPMKLRNHEIRQLIEDYEDSIDQLKEAIAMMKY